MLRIGQKVWWIEIDEGMPVVDSGKLVAVAPHMGNDKWEIERTKRGGGTRRIFRETNRLHLSADEAYNSAIARCCELAKKIKRHEARLNRQLWKEQARP